MAWFVMLNAQDREVLPLVDQQQRVVLFSTKQIACEEGERNPLGNACGYRVFEWLWPTFPILKEQP